MRKKFLTIFYLLASGFTCGEIHEARTHKTDCEQKLTYPQAMNLLCELLAEAKLKKEPFEDFYAAWKQTNNPHTTTNTFINAMAEKLCTSTNLPTTLSLEALCTYIMATENEEDYGYGS